MPRRIFPDFRTLKTKEGKQAVVRNGYLPERTIQTGLGDISVKVPKVRDRSNQGIKFNSKLVPPYLKKVKAIEELLPWLYLKGVSTGDFSEALQSLLGENAPRLSASTIGIYTHVRQDDRLCLLVIIGSTADGKKELIALDGVVTRLG